MARRIRHRTAAAAAVGLALALAAGGATTTTAADAANPADVADLTATFSTQLPFDPVWISQSGQEFVEITNHGATSVLVPDIRFTAAGSPLSEWLVNVGSCGGAPLAPGAICYQSLRYTPTQPWSGTVTIDFPGGPGGDTSVAIPVVAKTDDRPPVMHVPPIPAFTGPFLPFAVSAGYADDETGDGTEDVRVRLAAAGAAELGPWVYPKAWQGGRWGEGSGWLAYGLGIGSLSPGVTECFSYRARDTVGNVSAWTPPRCTSAMWDDKRALTPVRGWTRGTGDARFYEFGTWTRATVRGSTLAGPTVTSRRIAVLGTTCPTCGAVDVYVGTTRLGTLSMKGAMKHRALLMLPARATAVHGQIRLVVRTAGLLVIVDAIGTRIN
ncbi:MAG: hypothetical protein U0R76_15170 [Candidatus Nanopelagicales bacterium]